MMKKLFFGALVALMGLGGCTSSHGDVDGVRDAITVCYDLPGPEAEGCFESLEGEEPNAEEVIDACFEEHAECLAHIDNPEACDPLLEACFDVWAGPEEPAEPVEPVEPPEPGEPGEPEEPLAPICYWETIECTDSPDVTPEECLEMLTACIEFFEPPVVPEPPCEPADVCFAFAETPEEVRHCEELLELCLEYGPPEEPGEPCAPVEECFVTAETPEDAEHCETILATCHEYGPEPGETEPGPEEPEPAPVDPEPAPVDPEPAPGEPEPAPVDPAPSPDA